MAKTQDSGGSQHPDLLAAVVLHTLVSEGRAGMTVEQVALACERHPRDPHEALEVEAALEILLDDGLAMGENGLHSPTRAAIRAAELSF